MSILDRLSKHSMFSETLDTLNKDPSTAHQMKGFDFAQNFPSLTPSQGVYGPTSFVGPTLSKGYQYGQELSRALLDGIGGITIGDALSKAKKESDANIEGMLGKGFNMSDYQQNLQDFNIDDVSFARDFGIPAIDKAKGFAKSIRDLFSGSAVATEADVAKAIAEREALNRDGLMAIDDAGLVTPAYEDFAQVARPGFNLGFAKQLGKRLGTGILTALSLPAGLIAKGLSGMPGRVGIQGGVGLRGDTNLDTFARSTSLADFAQRMRDKRAAEEAAAIGAAKQKAKDLDYEYDAYGGGKSTNDYTTEGRAAEGFDEL